MNKSALVNISAGALLGAGLSLLWHRWRASSPSPALSRVSAAPRCPVQHRSRSQHPDDTEPATFLNLSTAEAQLRATLPVPHRGREPLYYHEYLQLDKVLNAQAPKSVEYGGALAHEEMLFIITHQSYELWFKQMLHDLGSVRAIFKQGELQDTLMATAIRRLDRLCVILRALNQQLGVLETMTPLDFLDFRDYLFPASGFQSVQFRLFENTLGLRKSDRLKYSKSSYCAYLAEQHQEPVHGSEEEASLFDLVQAWLERTPFVKTDDFDFWADFEASVARMFELERQDIRADASLGDEEREQRLQESVDSEQSFSSIFDSERYNKLIEAGRRRLSHRAMRAALFINLYRDEPVFQMPFRLLTLLGDIDQLLVGWRQHHADMVHRMLGMKLGTGGSSGYHYLKATASRHRIFTDFLDLSMYLIPRSAIPQLPDSVISQLRFHYAGSSM